MRIIMEERAREVDVGAVTAALESLGATPVVDPERGVVGAIRSGKEIDLDVILGLQGVVSATAIDTRYKLASRAFHGDTVITIGNAAVGGENRPLIIAGPCAVESRDQLFRTMEALIEGSVSRGYPIDAMRGGAFKPRTSPYDFQGFGEEGLDLLVGAREEFGLPIVTEITDARDIPMYLDRDIEVFQVGARAMQNYRLLAALSELPKDKVVLLKRGLSATIDQLLQAAEYILTGPNRDGNGNPNVVLCERGAETLDSGEYRFLLDHGAFEAVRKESHLPIIVDPSHAAGNRALVEGLLYESMNKKVPPQGMIVEVHENPLEARCDAAQALTPKVFGEIMIRLKGEGLLEYQ